LVAFFFPADASSSAAGAASPSVLAFLSSSFLFSLMVFATPPPAFFPAVAFNGSSCFLAGAEVSEDTGALTLI